MTLFRRLVPDRSPAASGEYCDVTVLFADLEGFTTLTEQLPANEVVAWLNAHFTAMVAQVDRFAGVVDRFIGDAMFVLWDGPTPEEAAARAVQAALAMQAAIATLQEQSLSEGKRPLKVRIGLSSGRAIRAEIGAPGRLERTVIGDVVNTAARLEALNKEFHTDVILSRATLDLAGPRAQVRELGTVTLKGRREPVTVYSLGGWQGEAP
jgi:class 3 adenylate cyclase